MKKIILIVLVAFFANGVYAQDFITRWNLNQPGSSSTQLNFGVGTTGTVNYTWETIPSGTTGSGSFSGSNAIITGLPTNAIIRLKINPTHFNRINIAYNVDRKRLVDIEQWGGVVWSSMETAFSGCDSLNISATDVPNLSSVTNMESMFRECSRLNSPVNIDTWNTSNVTNMKNLFYKAYKFKQLIENWNTNNVTNMSGMFSYALVFNQPIGNWNTSNVTDMSDMFRGDWIFNQPIGNWNTSNVTNMSGMFGGGASSIFNQPIGNWNTSNVTNMSEMFLRASFNQPIGNWNTSNVTDMNQMFLSASFNQPIGNWNTANVTDMYGMFRYAKFFNQSLENWNLTALINNQFMLDSCGMDCTNYSTTLIGWANNINTPNGRTLGAKKIKYGTNAVSSRNYLLNTKGWIINGDIANGFTCCVATSSNQTQTTCNSYSFNNQILTTSGIYSDTLLNSTGCDSIITLNLTINSSSNTLNQSACNSYTFNNQTITQSGIYYDTLINSASCDSIITLNLTINNSTSNTMNQSACNSYTFNNQTITQSGTYYDTLVNSAGCDSIITLNLTINTPTSNTINQSACNSYTFNNQTITTSGIYYDTLINANGCDSIITLNLTINNSNVATTQNGIQLSATSTGASYQWLTCNPFTIILGANSQTYTATANGDYAVIVTQNGCTDTSNCMTVNGVGINELNTQNQITISPNPTNSIFKIECPMNGAQVILYNSFGQKLLTSKIENQTSLIDISHVTKGIYIAEIIDDKTTYRVKIIKD